MADVLLTTRYYTLLGGVNQKASQYAMSTAQFLNLRNVDFDVPNALTKRPGSTFALGSSNGTSGPIKTVFEFQKLTGESYVLAASDTAIFYLANNAYTLLSSGWNNGQAPNMLTFVNKAWMANGQKWASWDGSTYMPIGFRSNPGASVGIINPNITNSFTVAGLTASDVAASFITVGIWMAYASLRSDGYMGPINFYKNATQLVQGAITLSALEWFDGVNQPSNSSGFTTQTGATALALFLAIDTMSIANLPVGAQYPYIGNSDHGLGYGIVETGGGNKAFYFANTLSPTADLSRFLFYTLIPANTATLTLAIPSWSAFVATDPQPFSAMIFDFFATYIPKYLEINQNIMFSSGYSAYPSTVFFSDPAAPETIQPTSSFEVRTNDGDKVYGLKAFNNQLIVLKERSFHRLTGSSPDTFQLVQVSGDYGCLSYKSIVSYKQVLLWLDRKGILSFNGSSFDIISESIEGIFKRMNIAAAKDQACAVHHLYRNQIWFGIPIDNSTVNNLTVVYDYLVGGWTFFDGFNAASFAYVKGPLARPNVWRGDYSGLIHYHSESFYSDSGQGISCVVLPRFENIGGENQTTLWRRFFLDNAVATGLTGQVSAAVFTNYDTSTVRATFAMYQSTFQNRVEMGVQGKAISIQLSHFSASLPLLINGFGIANRGLRNV